jgi:hypothetical protein
MGVEIRMNTIIDAGSELLIDRSTLKDPFLRLIADALGQTMVDGSAWVAVNKEDLGRAYQQNASPGARSKAARRQKM